LTHRENISDSGALQVSGMTTSQLLRAYGAVLAELRERGTIRSENSPVGDYAEYLASRAMGLTLVHKSSVGYDGVDELGVRYQVKARRITSWNRSRQLSAIRGMEKPVDPFDFLLGILFDADFGVARAALIPISVVRARASRQEYVNAWRLLLTDRVWELPDVVDVTARVQGAAAAG